MLDVNKLVKRIKKRNNPNDIDNLIRHYYKQIYAYIYKTTLDSNESYDLTQEVFIKVINNIHKYDENKSSFQTWLYKVAFNHTLNYFKSKGYKFKQISEEIIIEPEVEENHLEKLIMQEEIERVNEAILILPITQQEVIRLRFYADLSLEDISKELNLNLSTIKSRLYQGLKRLKSILKEGEINE